MQSTAPLQREEEDEQEEEEQQQQQQFASSVGLGTMPFSSMWDNFIRIKSSKKNLVRYEHPAERRQVSVSNALSSKRMTVCGTRACLRAHYSRTYYFPSIEVCLGCSSVPSDVVCSLTRQDPRFAHLAMASQPKQPERPDYTYCRNGFQTLGAAYRCSDTLPL
jgi:hypothetical protein